MFSRKAVVLGENSVALRGETAAHLPMLQSMLLPILTEEKNYA
jgi:hypothetical protein